MNVSDFKKHDQISHVKARPEMYIGSIKNGNIKRFIITETEAKKETETEAETEEETEEKTKVELKAELKDVYCNQGLEQCILELITNAIDHAERTKDTEDPVSKIEVELTDTTFSIKNNGRGIPIEVHPEYKVYVPELIFGNMLTSSNYDDTKTKTWMGTYGIGAKCCVIFSKKFTVEVCCSGQKYVQSFLNGLTSKTDPQITKCKNKDYTKIHVEPDFSAFSLKSFSEDIKGQQTHNKDIIIKRIYDTTAITSKKVSVYINGSKIQIKDFKEYTELYIGNIKKVHHVQKNWEIIVAKNPYEENTKISFVNSLCIEEGGTHADHVVDYITKKVIDNLKNTAKFKKVDIKPAYIKDNLAFFINCCIENPKFNSQTKVKLTTPVSEFKEKLNIPDEVISKICKLDFIEDILEIAKNKELKSMVSSTKGTKKSRLSDIPKLNDANFAGTSKSTKCTLILTEGDSACSMVLGAISVIGRDYYGVMPLKGKLINVRKASPSDLAKNEEIININKILGISYGQETKTNLRYHKILILCDSDHDGSHIKGLLINYFSFFCPKIITDDFITTLLTPVVKVHLDSNKNKKNKNNNVIEFYDINTFEKWASENKDNNTKYRAKYYKGLGTSKTEEAKEYFKNLDKNQVIYTWDHNRDIEAIKLAFDDSRENDRKTWIADSIKRMTEKGSLIDYSIKRMPISKFINDELVGYSIYSCYSKLPSIIDGLKVSQRKVLYASIKRGLHSQNNEMKVAQLGASCADITCYHHGETSLFDTIVNMANDYVGSNNLPLLYPSGTFCSRNAPNDNSSPRYIFTYLQPYVSLLFNDYDSKILEYNNEEGQQIEPKFYVPILPMVLINGSTAIATGWSSDIPPFSPKDIIECIRDLLNNDKNTKEYTSVFKTNTKSKLKSSLKLKPYYKGFRGTITAVKGLSNKWISKANIIPDPKSKKHYYIKELPIGLWYSKFKELLCKLEKEDIVDYFKPNSVSENGFNYEEYDIFFKEEHTEIQVIKLLKLEQSINGTNMVGFDAKGIIKKYESVEEILLEHFHYRLEFYDLRKKYIINLLERELLKETEKARFIKMVIDGTLVIFKVSTNVVIENIEKNNFKKIDEKYDYLLNMSISSFTQEKIEQLNKIIEKIENELKELRSKEPKDLWYQDLDDLEKEINKIQ